MKQKIQQRRFQTVKQPKSYNTQKWVKDLLLLKQFVSFVQKCLRVLLIEEGLQHSVKHAPVPTFLKRVARIKFKIIFQKTLTFSVSTFDMLPLYYYQSNIDFTLFAAVLLLFYTVSQQCFYGNRIVSEVHICILLYTLTNMQCQYNQINNCAYVCSWVPSLSSFFKPSVSGLLLCLHSALVTTVNVFE